MKIRSEHFLSLSSGVMLMLLLSACSLFGSGTSKTTSPNNQTPAQVLQNSFHVMQQLKTAHVSLNVATTMNSGNTGQGMFINVKADGDEQLPDQASLKLTVSQGAQTMANMAEIVTGNTMYFQYKGHWYMLNASTFTGSAANPFAGTQVSNYNNLLNAAQKATISDKGMETLNGHAVRHISVTFGKDALEAILNATGQLNTLSAQQRQNIQSLLNNVSLNQAVFDTWIDSTNSYPQRMELKFNMTAKPNVKGTSTTGAAAAVTSNVDTVIDYSKFNAPVNITPPANAIPANNPATIFQ